MTRKHYIAIAKALNDTDAGVVVSARVADALAQFNPRFDRARFINAAAPENQ